MNDTSAVRFVLLYYSPSSTQDIRQIETIWAKQTFNEQCVRQATWTTFYCISLRRMSFFRHKHLGILVYLPHLLFPGGMTFSPNSACLQFLGQWPPTRQVPHVLPSQGQTVSVLLPPRHAHPPRQGRQWVGRGATPTIPARTSPATQPGPTPPWTPACHLPQPHPPQLPHFPHLPARCVTCSPQTRPDCPVPTPLLNWVWTQLGFPILDSQTALGVAARHGETTTWHFCGLGKAGHTTITVSSVS